MPSNSPLPRGPASGPYIKKTYDIKTLTADEEAVLRNMFNTFDQVAIEAEFGRGFSGSRVFRIRPTEAGGKVNLPAVVKIAPIYLIHKERQAYEIWVKDTLPKVSQLKMASNLPDNSTLGGLYYSMAGGDTSKAYSLADYYQKSGIDDLCWVLENRLFKTLGQYWWLNHYLDYTFQMQADYDSWLPVNLKLIPINSPSTDVPLIRIHINSLPPPVIEIGDQVEFKDFLITEVDQRKKEVTLNLPQPSDKQVRTSYRVRLVDVQDVAKYSEGDVIGSIYGQVTATRHGMLVDLTSQILGPDVDLTKQRLAPFRGLVLPNPLFHYHDLLWEILPVYVSTVHGDFNLENIIVDPETREAELIDFATTHQGHALIDLLRLEVEVVVNLLAPTLDKASLPPETIYTLYEQLHQISLYSHQTDVLYVMVEKPFEMLRVIRKMAQKVLFNQDDWSEYYQGLILYLLSILKFKTISRWSKRTAFWGAATAQHLLEVSSTPTTEISELHSPGPTPRSTIWSVIESPFGTMPPDSKYYIERAADHVCWEHLGRDFAVTLFVQAPRQMGKSSLMHRMLHRAKTELNKPCAFIDFQEFPKEHFINTSEESFLIEFCLMIGEELGITEAIDKYWVGRRTNIVKCNRYLEEYIIPQVNEPFILAMDEVDRLLPSPFRNNFLGMLRSWHNKRARKDKNFRNVTLFLSSSTENSLLIEDERRSPFNVAEPIILQDFTRTEVEELNNQYGSPLTIDQIDEWVALTNGHPHLTRVALNKLVAEQIDIDTLFAQAAEESGPFAVHLVRYLRMVLREATLKKILTDVCYDNSFEENYIFHLLMGLGLIKRAGEKVVFRNKLYERYFKKRLMKKG